MCFKKRQKMCRRKKTKLVYCPNCGNINDADVLYCKYCKKSLKDAIEIDYDEDKNRKKREKQIKIDNTIRTIKNRKDALFEKAPILKPLYYMALIGLAVGILIGIVKVFKASVLAGFVIVTIIFVCLYIVFAPLIIDNIDYFDTYIDRLPPISRGRERVIVHRLLWGFVVGGFILIISLLSLIYALITEAIG